ncbi:PAS domain-containing sensor histidine kinase [Paenibacillus sp. Marseille-Q4541]|uniref:PAS domain-containing sensor histidine kinase n=1 Tax=Paenibacillus sp. Marseille-Q4541 TaxID=2831522 RepID=UPI001BAD0D23|nr:PAS domain-containing sensor histidine kinase [Paenibacillus sp. Marseille-Q4541]
MTDAQSFTTPFRNYSIDTLVNEVEHHMEHETVKNEVKSALRELTDLKIALDESSIVAMTDTKGKILYVNDKFCEISKYTREELIGQDHRIINSGYHDSAFMKDLWTTIRKGKVWQGEIRNTTKDGNYYWVNTTIVPLMDEEGKPQRYLAVRNEVTRLKQTEAELQSMMTKVIRIQEDERKRFSRELHDGIGQSLYSLVIQLDQLTSNESVLPSDLQPLREQVTAIIEDVRGLAWQLRPSVLDDLGVVPAIRTYIEKFTSYYGIDVSFECHLRRRLPHQLELAMYRIIQEALTNIAKHADAEEAIVTIDDREAKLIVTISDNGEGFTAGAAGNEAGVGLFSMEERARSAGGTLKITSSPGEGTMITLIFAKE